MVLGNGRVGLTDDSILDVLSYLKCLVVVGCVSNLSPSLATVGGVLKLHVVDNLVRKIETVVLVTIVAACTLVTHKTLMASD